MGLPTTAGYIGGRCVKWLTRIELSAGGQAHVHLACCSPEQETAAGKQMHLASSPATTCILHKEANLPLQRRAATTTTSRQGAADRLVPCHEAQRVRHCHGISGAGQSPHSACNLASTLVSPLPSQDNKVLPSDVDQERANKEGGLS